MKQSRTLLAAAAAVLLAGTAQAQAPRLTRIQDLESRDALAAVKRAVGNARVVVIAQPVYGDGAALAASVRLVRMLHGELGFDVLALESGQLDMERVDRAIADTTRSVLSAAALGVIPFWARATEGQDLLEYVRASRAGSRPITLAGFDVQPTSVDPTLWAKDVIAGLSAAAVDQAELARFSDINRYLHEGSGAAWAAVLPALLDETRKLQQMAQFRRKALADTLGPHRAQLLERSLEDALTYYQLAQQARTTTTPRPADQNARERRMGDNLLWLAHNRFPARRIIVWLRTQHALYTPAALQDSAGQAVLPGVSTAGSILHSALQGDVFTIALTAGGGEHAHVLEKVRHPVPVPTAGSIETACRSFTTGGGFADLRSSNRSFGSHLLGYTHVRTRWDRQVDGILCLPVARPAGVVGRARPAAEAHEDS